MTIAPNDFVHLHTHSEFSLLDGLGRITDLVDTAGRHGFDSLAVTDHGALYGSVAFYQAATKAGIRPIIGVETYVARRGDDGPGAAGRRQPFHLVLLATDMTGYQNLCRLVTDAHIDGFYYKPRIDHEHLAKHSQGLVGLSRLPRRRDPQGARDRGLGARPHARRHVRGDPGQGPLLPGAPGPRHPRAAPPQRAAAPAGARDRPAAGRHQRPALRPPRAARGARRPALRRDREQHRHAQPDAVRGPGVLPQDRGRDAAAVPGPARGAAQHPAHRGDGGPQAAPGRPPDPALPGARRRDGRDVAAQGVRGGPRPPLRRDHARPSSSAWTTSWA